MKIAVVNMVGNIGKSTIAAHLLMPRMKDKPRFFSIETINSGAEKDGISVEKMKGKQFGELTDEMMRCSSAIVDVGSTNLDDFLKQLQQFHGSHEDFDCFLVPAVSGKVGKDRKAMEDTVKTILQLQSLGVDRKRVKVVFNQVDTDDDIFNLFSPLFGLAELQKNCTVSEKAAIYSNEVFDRIKSLGLPLAAVLADKTDYKAQLRTAKTEEEKDRAIDMITLRRLATSANKNLDDVYAALFK